VRELVTYYTVEHYIGIFLKEGHAFALGMFNKNPATDAQFTTSFTPEAIEYLAKHNISQI